MLQVLMELTITLLAAVEVALKEVLHIPGMVVMVEVAVALIIQVQQEQELEVLV